jgi:F-type H+-transporting ATPase subunit delta
MARPSTAARRYAEAAFEIAVRDGTVDAWRADLEAAAAALAGPAVARAVENPAIAPAVRERAVRAGLESSIGRATLNLILFMLRRRRIDQLPRVVEEFRRLDDQRRGIVHATATSAMPLATSEVTALTARLEQLTGGRVELTVETDPSLLGGLVVRVGDRLIDGSVRGRLERLRNQLVSGAL